MVSIYELAITQLDFTALYPWFVSTAQNKPKQPQFIQKSSELKHGRKKKGTGALIASIQQIESESWRLW